MALISLRQLLDHAAEYQYGVPAFNVNNLEQTRALREAPDAPRTTTARPTRSPSCARSRVRRYL